MIQLTNDLVLIANSECYIVGKAGKSRGKGPELTNPKYYTTAAQAVRGALAITMRQRVGDGSITTLRQFIEEQEQLQYEFKRLLEPLEVGPQR